MPKLYKMLIVAKHFHKCFPLKLQSKFQNYALLSSHKSFKHNPCAGIQLSNKSIERFKRLL